MTTDQKIIKNKEKIVPLHPIAVQILKGFTSKTYSPWAFPSPRDPQRHRQAQGWYTNHFKAAAERAGINGRRFHDLRHAHIVELLFAGADPRSIQEQLGLSSLSLIQRYTKLATHVLRGNINRLPATPGHQIGPKPDRRKVARKNIQ